MQRALEFFIILIIFYGVYQAFDKASVLFADRPSQFAIVIAALVAATLLLGLYAYTLQKSATGRYKNTIKDLKKDLEHKDKELKDAFKIKRDVQQKAQEFMKTSSQEDTSSADNGAAL